MTRELILLVGVPGSGKSTFLDNNQKRYKDYVICSTHDHIEEYAKCVGKTYNEVFKECYKEAEKNFFFDIEKAVYQRKSIIIDRTNTTRKSRKRFLDHKDLKGYKKSFIFFPTPPEDIHKERLKSRIGKEISWNIVSDMIKRLEVPTHEEFNQEIEYRIPLLWSGDIASFEDLFEEIKNASNEDLIRCFYSEKLASGRKSLIKDELKKRSCDGL